MYIDVGFHQKVLEKLVYVIVSDVIIVTLDSQSHNIIKAEATAYCYVS